MQTGKFIIRAGLKGLVVVPKKDFGRVAHDTLTREAFELKGGKQPLQDNVRSHKMKAEMPEGVD